MQVDLLSYRGLSRAAKCMHGHSHLLHTMCSKRVILKVVVYCMTHRHDARRATCHGANYSVTYHDIVACRTPYGKAS